MKTVNKVFLAVLVIFISCCTDDGDMKGTLTIAVTDSPMDADNVKSVNIFITSVEAQTGSTWKSLKSFDQPVGINLTDYSGGNSYALIDQFIDPGKFSALRFNMNLADLNSSFLRSPQCNVVFANGSTKPLYYFESGTSAVVVTKELTVSARGHTDFTFDFDIRKSLTLDDNGNYVFKPAIRIIETAKAGNIHADVMNFNATDRLVVFAYSAGQFSVTETNTPVSGEVRFANAVTSFKVANNKLGLGFLPEGSYDLVFAKHSATGEYLSIMGHFKDVVVVAGQTTQIDIDLTKLTGS